MKAILGSWDPRPTPLLAEVTALRSKVAELKEELESLRAENAMLRDLTVDLDLEPEDALATSSA